MLYQIKTLFLKNPNILFAATVLQAFFWEGKPRREGMASFRDQFFF